MIRITTILILFCSLTVAASAQGVSITNTPAGTVTSFKFGCHGCGPVVAVPVVPVVPVAPAVIYRPVVQYQPLQYQGSTYSKKVYPTPIRNFLFGKGHVTNYYAPYRTNNVPYQYPRQLQ